MLRVTAYFRLQRLESKQQQRQQQKLSQAEPKQFFMITKVLQRVPASIDVTMPSLVPDWCNWILKPDVAILGADSGAGAEGPANEMPDKFPPASKQNESTANSLAAILGYEYVANIL